MSDTNSSDKESKIFTITFPKDTTVVGRVDDTTEVPRDFDEAIEATGYGRFHYLLLLAILPGRWTTVFATTSTAYLISSADCDLEMDLFRKGVLNAMIYAGMISSGFLWGFLADRKGRKSVLRIVYFGDAVCNILCSMSQKFWMLLTFKFLSGLTINGAFAINMTYLAEFQDKNNRSKAMMWIGLFISLGNVAIPALAWGIIPRSWSFVLFDGAFVYNSWRIFLLACSIPSVVAFIVILYLPESPKFLMSRGRNDEALKIFRWIYAMNTGKPADTFPIKVLCQDGRKKKIEPSDQSLDNAGRSDGRTLKELFEKPYFGTFLLLVTIQFCGLLGMNTLRLWLPQLFTTMENFDYNNRDPNLGSPTLCEMIGVQDTIHDISNDTTNSTITCVPTIIQDRVYINAMIIAAASTGGFLLAEQTIDAIGKKNLLLAAFFVSAACSFFFNWSPNADITLVFASVYITLTSISNTTAISFVVDLMPTALRSGKRKELPIQRYRIHTAVLRTTTISIIMSIGRCGAILGNILFPILLSMGCMIPFMVLGGFLLTCFVLSIFIPKPTGKLL